MKRRLRIGAISTVFIILSLAAGCAVFKYSGASPSPAASVKESPSARAAVVSKSYYVVDKNGRKGVVNERGQTVMPFEYSEINQIVWEKRTEAFFAVRAVVYTTAQERLNEGTLYDVSGDPLSDIKCGYAYALCDGLIEYYNDGKSGVISFKGESVIPCKYDNVAMCGDSIVASEGDFYNESRTVDGVDVDVYDKQGGLIRSANLNYFNICGGNLLISDDTGQKLGLAGLDFKEILPPVYDRLELSSGGLYIAASEGKCGVIDVEGNEIIPLVYDNMYEFYQEGNYEIPFFCATGKDGAYIFDSAGKQLSFFEGFMRAHIENGSIITEDNAGMYHCINPEGEDLIPPAQYIYADENGLIICGQEQKYAVYNKDGGKLPLPESEMIGVISPERFIFAENSNGYFKYGICGSDGEVIVPPENDLLYMYRQDSDLLIFVKTEESGKTSAGIIDSEDGSIALEGFDYLGFKGDYYYDFMRTGDDDLLYAWKGATHGLVDINGNWIWYTSDYETLMD